VQHVYDSDALAMSLYSVPLKKDNLVVIDDENEYAEELEYNPKTSKGTHLYGVLRQDSRSGNFEIDLGRQIRVCGGQAPRNWKFAWVWRNRLLFAGATRGRDGYLYKELAFYSLQEKLPPYSIITEGPPVIDIRSGCSNMFWNERECISFHYTGGPYTGAYFYLPKRSVCYGGVRIL
jgi:hypothetical protein